MRKMLILLAAAAAMPPGLAIAQNGGVIIMRRPIAPDNQQDEARSVNSVKVPKAEETPSSFWRTSDWMWEDGASDCSRAAIQVRTVTCTLDGQSVEDAICSQNSIKPTETQVVDRSEGCSYAWTKGPWSDETGICSNDSLGVRAVVCRRSDGSTANDQFCEEPKPATVRHGENIYGCETAWAVGGWGSSIPACSRDTIRTRNVSCNAIVPDGVNIPLPDDRCESDKKPSAQEGPNTDYSECTGTWHQTPWTNTTACVDGSKSEIRTAQCFNDGNVDSNESTCNPEDKPQDEERSVGCDMSEAP